MRSLPAFFSVTGLLGTTGLRPAAATTPSPRYCLTPSCHGPGSSPLIVSRMSIVLSCPFK
jgi:hypothetical protein